MYRKSVIILFGAIASLLSGWAFARNQGAVTDLTDPTCGVVRTNQFDDPSLLAAEYLRRVDDGQFLSRWDGVGDHPGPEWTTWLRSALLCPARLPAIRTVADAVIVARYAVGPSNRSGDSVVVTVDYAELGRLKAGVFCEARQRQSVDVILRRTPWGWRVVNHDPTQRVSAPAALSRVHLSHEGQRQLEEVVKRQ